MQFHIRALSIDHVMMQLTIDARDEAEARQQMGERGLFVAAILPASRFSTNSGQRADHMKALSLVLFSQELLALLNAGLSIVEALDALLEKETGSVQRRIVGRLLTGLREGKRFSSVLTEQPEQFGALYIGIIKAAEGTSDLPRSLSRFIDYQQRIDAVRAKVISASIYPLILLAVGGGVGLFLIGYVVPRFAEVYQGTGRALPWLSQQMLNYGKFASTHLGLMAVGALSMVFASILLLRGLTTGTISGVLSRLPGVGERIRLYALARLYLTLGMLLDGGIPIMPALHTVQEIVPPALSTALERTIKLIGAGTPMSQAFEAEHLTTPVSLRLLRVGERSGDLGAMLMQSAAFHDGEINRWIDRFTRMVEPLLMATIGIVVGAIVILLYMPIFDLADSLQ